MTVKPASSGGPPSAAVRVLHVFALCGFAVAQPLYELLSRFAPFLVAHASEAADVMATAAALSLGLPLLLSLPGVALARLVPRAGWCLHLSSVGLLVTLLGLQLVRGSLASTPAAVLAASALGALATWSYARFERVRSALSWLAAAAVVFPLLFLFVSPVRSLLLGERPGEAASLARPATTPVFVLVLDEFPLFSLLDAEEHLDAGRFPNIAALAADSLWFRNATTVAQSTAYGVPAILSGRYPFKELLLPVVNDYRQNLFTLLAAGYNLNVFETGTRLCPIKVCSGDIVRPALKERLARLFADITAVYLHLVTPRELAARLPGVDEGWAGFWEGEGSSERLTKKDFDEAKRIRKYRWDHPRETFADYLDSIARYPRPTLHYLHVLLPHVPWINLPDGHSFIVAQTPGLESRIWTGTQWQIAQNLQRHVLQVGFVDRLMGAFRARLEEAGLYEDSLIVLVSDHGAGFRQGEARRWLTPGPGRNLSDLANVPLIVKFPGGGPRGIDDRNVETIDVLPTILEVLGVDTRDLGLDGVSLTDRTAARRMTKRIYPTRGNQSRRGTPIVFDVSDLDGRRDVLRFKIDHLGTAGWERVYAMGPYGALVGSSLGNPALQSTAETIALDRRESYAAVDLNQERLPLWVSGSLGGDSERWVAIALNDRIAAVTQTYLVEGTERFGALVAPASLEQGQNEVEVRTLEPAWLEAHGDGATAP